jgi:glycine dehydrogenase subunit 1
LSTIRGCSLAFDGPRFKELVLRTPVDGRDLSRALARHGYLVGPGLGRWYPELADCLLVAITERRTEDDIAGLAEAIEKELAER